MARKKDEGGSETGARLSPVDVQQVQFRRALRGYDEQEVDDFLDRITEELTRLLDERRSLTERAGQLPTIRVQSGDAAEVSKQTEELVAQARERAEAIVRDAQQRAASIAREAESQAGGRAPAAAAAAAVAMQGPHVSAFVAKEREFLQRLAALVQGHAQSVKDMVATAREPGAGPGSGTSGGATGASAGAASSGAVSGGSQASGPIGSGGRPAAGGSTGTSGGSGMTAPGAGPSAASGRSGSSSSAAPSVTGVGESHVRVPDLVDSPSRNRPEASTSSPVPSQPEASTAPPVSKRIEVPPSPARPAPQTGPGAAPGGEETSLRELFWGEDF